MRNKKQNKIKHQKIKAEKNWSGSSKWKVSSKKKYQVSKVSKVFVCGCYFCLFLFFLLLGFGSSVPVSLKNIYNFAENSRIAQDLCLYICKSVLQCSTCFTRKLRASINSCNVLQDNQIKDGRQEYDNVIVPWESSLFLVGTILHFTCLILISLSPWATVYCSVSELRPKTSLQIYFY